MPMSEAIFSRSFSSTRSRKSRTSKAPSPSSTANSSAKYRDLVHSPAQSTSPEKRFGSRSFANTKMTPEETTPVPSSVFLAMARKRAENRSQASPISSSQLTLRLKTLPHQLRARMGEPSEINSE